MSVVKSLNLETRPEQEGFRIHHQDSEINRLLDEIVMRFSSLIADVEDGQVDSEVLKGEISKLVDEQKGIFDLDSIKRVLFNTIYGYGELQVYIDDASISDIDAASYDFFTVKRKGIVEQIPFRFESEKAFERYCKLLIIRNGGVINEIDNHCRVSDLKNHLRINVCISPRNTSGTSLTIRKHPKDAYGLQTLLDLEMLDDESLRVIGEVVKKRGNLLISGKGGAGKTTLLRAIIEASEVEERMLICESDVEIAPKRKNCISQSIKKMVLGGRSVTLNDLIKDGLTMSLDTYCIGELTGGEAWEFLKAGNTDHRILGTIHANSASESVLRMMTLVETETRLSEAIVKQMIYESVHYIVYLASFKVMEIVELRREGGKELLRTCYRRKEVNAHDDGNRSDTEFRVDWHADSQHQSRDVHETRRRVG